MNGPLKNRRQFISALAATSAGWTFGCSRQPRRASQPPVGARLILPEDEDFEPWRRGMIWQARKPRALPAAIARVDRAEDVPGVINWARRQGLQVVARSGGHHLWGSTLREGALTLDLGGLTDALVDPTAQRVAVGPSLWSRELGRKLTAEGQAFPIAHCATVPMGGYLLGGGFGLNGDEWGSLACFLIEAADVVTANGRLRRIDATSDPDLFWALRGSGNGFFGIVTRYYLRTLPLPKFVSEAAFVFPLERATEVAAVAEEIASHGLRNTELMMLLGAAPDATKDGGPNRVCILRAVVFAEDEANARAILEPLSQQPLIGEASFATGLQPTGIDKLQLGSIDYRSQFGFGRYLVDSTFCDDPVAGVDELVRQFGPAPGHHTHCVVIFKNRPRLPEDAACSVMAPCWMGRYAVWQEPSDDPMMLSWIESSAEALQPFATGHYINEIDVRAGTPRIKACFSERAWERLRGLKAERDPTNLFADFHGLG